jgi:hypothetical protein
LSLGRFVLPERNPIQGQPPVFPYSEQDPAQFSSDPAAPKPFIILGPFDSGRFVGTLRS